jgi:hypothetical protein
VTEKILRNGPPAGSLKLGRLPVEGVRDMWIVGIILLLLAAGAAVYGRSRRNAARTATATDTLTCDELTKLASGVAEEVGGGSFVQRVEVAGSTVAGTDGPVEGPYSQTKAVWYRGQVTHRYWQMQRRETDGKTSWDRVENTETVSDLSSEIPFLVDDGSGAQVVVDPRGADIDHAQQTVDRFEPGTGPGGGSGGSGASGMLGSILSAAIRTGDQSGTIGFGYHEWVIRPGVPVYVHGVATDATGRVGFAKPDQGKYMISTRTEAEIVGEATSHAKWANIGAITLAVLGVILVVVGLATA